MIVAVEKQQCAAGKRVVESRYECSLFQKSWSIVTQDNEAATAFPFPTSRRVDLLLGCVRREGTQPYEDEVLEAPNIRSSTLPIPKILEGVEFVVIARHGKQKGLGPGVPGCRQLVAGLRYAVAGERDNVTISLRPGKVVQARHGFRWSMRVGDMQNPYHWKPEYSTEMFVRVAL